MLLVAYVGTRMAPHNSKPFGVFLPMPPAFPDGLADPYRDTREVEKGVPAVLECHISHTDLSFIEPI